MIMLTRLLNLLRLRYGSPCQVIGTGSWTPDIYVGNPDVSDVWSFHRHLPFPFERSWRPVRRALLETSPGPIYICERHYRQLPRIRRMLWLSGVDPARCVYMKDPGPHHLIDSLMELGTRTPPLLRAEAYPVPDLESVDGPRLHVLAADKAVRERRIAANSWSGHPLILIQPGNHRTMSLRRSRWRRRNLDDKWWPLERWAELLQRIHAWRSDAVLILHGAREEMPMLEEIRALARVPNTELVSSSLRELFALAAVAHSMISVDTGPAHAAAALGVPLVVLYGAETPKQWLPRSPVGSPVIGVGGPPVSTRADQIPVGAVFDAWRALGDRLPQDPAER